MSGRSLLHSWPVALALLMIPLVRPEPLYACGNAVRLQSSAAVKLAAEVDAAVDRGDYNKVLSLFNKYNVDRKDDGEFGDLQYPLPIQTANPKLRAHLSRARGVAYLRTGNLHKAVAIFSDLLSEDNKNPYLRTRLGEARSLSPDPADRARGKTILEELAKADLLVDAEGYLALARVSATAAREQALVRCRQMSRAPALCQLDDQTTAAAVPPAASKPEPAATPHPPDAQPAPAPSQDKR